MTDAIFDGQASDYDDIAQSALGVELRRRVHTVLADLLKPTDTVADLGCGSGIDAAWLAPQVGSVAAFDIAPEMVRIATERCRSHQNVTINQADVAALELGAPVDLVLVNFGVINCVGDLREFGLSLNRMVRPGGLAVIVTMPRWCPIELGIGALTRNRELLRRRRGVIATGGYSGLHVRYASARDLAGAFEPGFKLTRAESLGLALPPFEQRRWVQERARLLGMLAAMDRQLGWLGARSGLGDHHLAVFRRSP